MSDITTDSKMRLPQLPRPSRPKFLRRKCSDDGNDVDLEAQAHPLPGTVVCSSSATTSASASASASAVDEKGHDHSASMHFRGQQHLDAELPSYDAIVAAARRSSRDTQRSGRERLDVEEDEAQPRPSISVRPPFHGDQENPTILVLFKEDYAWARAYLKDMDYRVALRRALRRHLYSESGKQTRRSSLTLSRMVRAHHHHCDHLGARERQTHHHCRLLQARHAAHPQLAWRVAHPHRPLDHCLVSTTGGP